MKKIADLLIDRNIPRPPSRLVTPTLDVPRQELVRRQQAADAAHVPVTITKNLVAHAFQRHQPALVGFERCQNPLQLEITPNLIRPKLRRNRPVRREHENDPLGLRPGRIRSQRWQRGQKRQRGSGQTQLAEKTAARGEIHG